MVNNVTIPMDYNWDVCVCVCVCVGGGNSSFKTQK